MCEASDYIIADGQERLVLETVDKLENRDGEIHMVNVFGEQRTLKARIKTLSLVNHKIILEEAD